MDTSVRSRVIKIGNSRGVRIPKPMLEQAGLRDEVELLPQADGLLLRPIRRARAGWSEQFARMAAEGDDQLLDAETMPSTSFDNEEWQW